MNCQYCKSNVSESLVKQGFKFQRCLKCNSLMFDSNIEALYNETYYSFVHETYKLNLVEKLSVLLPLPFIFQSIFGAYLRGGLGPWFGRNRKNAILDYGAGNGRMLRSLSKYLTARKTSPMLFFYDPFATLVHSSRLTLEQLKDGRKFDLILLSHVLEHFDNVESEVLFIHKVLSENGKLVVRVPIVNSFWLGVMGEKWCQLDPPFHKTIPSISGLKTLFLRNNFEIVSVIYDGTDFPWNGLFGKICSRFFVFRMIFRMLQVVFNLFGFSDQVSIVLKKTN